MNSYQQTIIRSDKLDKRSRSTKRGKVRVFVNTAHKKLCQRLLGSEFHHFHQCDKGNWKFTFKEGLQKSLENRNVMIYEHVNEWVIRLVEEGPWEN